jgi:SAM-dependent methyltransferase
MKDRPLPDSRRLLRRIKSGVLSSTFVYRAYLGLKFGRARVDLCANKELPNGVLKSREEWLEADARGRRLRMPLHRSPEKNWDHLAAAEAIATALPRSARLLDAGAEFYGNLLPALFVFGFHDLYGMNLSFTDHARRGPIKYLPGDITRSSFPDGHFDAVTCMSVIEHGVPLEAYFREMYRLLKPGGLLITSTDYYPEPIDTGGKSAHGAPIKIFTRSEAEAMIALAKDCGFETTGEIDLDCDAPTVCWDFYGLEYTFLIFTLRKPAENEGRG